MAERGLGWVYKDSQLVYYQWHIVILSPGLMRPANVTIQSNLLEEFIIIASDSACKSFAAAASECAEAAMLQPLVG